MKSLKNFTFLLVGLLMVAASFVAPSLFGNSIAEDMPLADVALNRFSERELLKNFRHENTFMSALTSKNQWVNNDIIDITEIGVDPTVLIDNNTYPIAVSSRVDDSTPVKLKKFDTENTKITDDELYALPYDKIGSVQMQHREALEEVTAQYGLHSLAPLENTAKTPVLETTGADDGTGRLRLKSADIIKLKKAYDKNKIPSSGRVLVLCADHVADLLVEDLNFQQRYQNTAQGVIASNYYGFTVYEHVYNPVYANGDLKKKAYGAASAGTDRNASTAFYAPHAVKATGSVQRYLRKASEDPENRQTVAGFRLYHIVLPMRALGTGAIIDGRA